MKKIQVLFSCLLLAYALIAQTGEHKRAVFFGNSYTNFNNLPSLVASFAESMGDTLTHSANTPGGYTLESHSTNTQTLNLISQGNWDYMVLQEQSQRPSFPIGQVQASTFPYATTLDTTFKASNPCGETVFYMTWGRKNGDASNCAVWPPVCTYEGMDSLLALRYRMMADDNEALLSPVGAVWRYLRDFHPTIELYTSDQSHPTQAGSYAAACSFYTVFFRKDPNLSSYDYSLDPIVAQQIRSAASLVVYDQLSFWNVDAFLPTADFTSSNTNPNTVNFSSTSDHASEWYWDFGDGSTDTIENPSHVYAFGGNYSIEHVAIHCEHTDTIVKQVMVSSIEEEHQLGMQLYPNPASDILNISINDAALIHRAIEIYDALGRTVDRMDVVSESMEVSIQHYRPGLYSIRIVGAAEQHTLSFVKK